MYTKWGLAALIPGSKCIHKIRRLDAIRGLPVKEVYTHLDFYIDFVRVVVGGCIISAIFALGKRILNFDDGKMG
jgi:hypothetical protein